MNRLAFLALAFLLLPLSASAELRITEVAWMGRMTSTTTLVNDEWIEIYNDGGKPLSLSGYSLEWDSTNKPKVVSLFGDISAGGYFLLERDDDKSVPDIKADLIYPYVNALSNEGEVINIKKDGASVFTLDASGGWPAGDNGTKETMQWSGSTWVTATATPKAPYTGSASSTNNNVATSTATTTPEVNTSSQNISSHSSPVALSVAPIKNTITISLGRDRLGLVDIPLLFSIFSFDSAGAPFRGNISTRWSFGDGSGTDGIDAHHSYSAPGEYVVIATVRYLGEEAIARINVTIAIPDLALFSNEYGVGIINNGKEEINIGGFNLGDEKDKSVLPEDTIIKSKANVIFATSTQSLLKNISSISLSTPLGKVLAGPFAYKKEESSSVTLSEEAKVLTIANLKKEISSLQIKITSLTSLREKTPQKVMPAPSSFVPVPKEEKVLPEKNVALLAPITVEKEPGFLAGVASFPGRAWRTFKEIVF
jgi:hypothetical protein